MEIMETLLYGSYAQDQEEQYAPAFTDLTWRTVMML